MPNVIAAQQSKPNRFDESTNVNSIDYYTKYARYAIYNGLDRRHTEFQQQAYINRQFTRGNQWVDNEDLEAFFRDTSGQARNRIKVIKNYIKPVIEQYRGNAIIMDITIKAEATSYKAINRREEMLAEQKFFTDVAMQSSPQFASYLKAKMPLGDNQEETETIFENLYVDSYVDSINAINEYIFKENRLKETQGDTALDLAQTGMAVFKYYVHNGELKWRKVKPERFFFDRNCLNSDLSDAMYCGEWDYLTPSTMFECWQNITEDERKSLENYASNNFTVGSQEFALNGRVPVYWTYWRDFKQYKYGYVMDEFGYPMCVRIGYIEEGETKPTYTDKDLIPVKDLTETQKKKLGNKNSKKLYFDIVKYCVFVPSEIVSNYSSATENSDIILEYGEMPWQDTEYLDISNVSFPYKVGIWNYEDGYTETNISQLINPQRMVNRYASVQEQQVNNSHGKGLFIDSSMIDAQDGEQEMLNNIYQGKPVLLAARGRGMHNAVSEQGSMIDNSVLAYDTLQESQRTAMDRIAGVNASLRGESQGSDQLVGVTQLQIQRGSLIQESFYSALANIYLQIGQTNANLGKRIYADNPRKMAIILGDNKAAALARTKDIKSEDFRVFMDRQADHKQQIDQGNLMLTQFLQMGIIDQDQFADLYTRSTPLEISQALRLKSKEKALIAMAQSKAQAEAMPQMEATQANAELAQAAELQDTKNREDANKQADRDTKLAESAMKLAANQQAKDTAPQI